MFSFIDDFIFHQLIFFPYPLLFPFAVRRYMLYYNTNVNIWDLYCEWFVYLYWSHQMNRRKKEWKILSVMLPFLFQLLTKIINIVAFKVLEINNLLIQFFISRHFSFFISSILSIIFAIYFVLSDFWMSFLRKKSKNLKLKNLVNRLQGHSLLTSIKEGSGVNTSVTFHRYKRL